MMLTQNSAMRPVPKSQRLPTIARVAVVLEVFLGLGALFGGGQFIAAPDGHVLGMTTRTLAGTPFPSYLIPGIILFAFIGVGPLIAAAITVRRQAVAPLAAVAVGVTLIGWICVEMVFLAGIGSLAWAFYLVLGCCIAALGIVWWRASPSALISRYGIQSLAGRGPGPRPASSPARRLPGRSSRPSGRL
jgi:hypothetical protein